MMRDQIPFEEDSDIEIQDFPHYMPLGEAVFQTLKEAILKGSLRPGQLLSENKIAAKLNVSRTPVREAFRRLEQENLVTFLSGRRLMVTIPTIQDIEELYEIRLLVESEALRRIGGDETIIGQLKDCLEIADNQLKLKNIHGLSQATTEFHVALVSTLNNRRLEQFFDSLQDTIALYRSYSLYDERWAEESEDEHKQILENLKKGDAKEAIRILERHLARGKEVLISMIPHD